MKPDLAEAGLSRGTLFYLLKRYVEALAAYDKVTSRHPDLAEAWLGRGHVCFDLGRHEEDHDAVVRHTIIYAASRKRLRDHASAPSAGACAGPYPGSGTAALIV